MAKIVFKGIDEYAKQMAELGAHAEGVCKYAVYDAAGMVIDAIKAACPVDSGDLRDSFVLTTFRNDNGYVYTKVVAEGYDSRGVPNAIKARVLESGNSTHPKRPFIRPAVNGIKGAVETSIEINLNKKLQEYFK